MSLFKNIKRKITIYKANKTQESKRNFLRSLGCKVGEGTRFVGRAQVGDDPFLVEIGSDCLISNDVSFLAHDGGVKVLNGLGYFNGQRMDKMARIKIGNNCFIGCGAVILGGVRIGDNVIIGTRSIVTKDIPSGTVAAGMPAKVICTIEEYYQKNCEKGVFFPTPSMSKDQKIDYLKKNVPELD